MSLDLHQFLSHARRSRHPHTFISRVARWFFAFDWLSGDEVIAVDRRADGVTLRFQAAAAAALAADSSADAHQVLADSADATPGTLAAKSTPSADSDQSGSVTVDDSAHKLVLKGDGAAAAPSFYAYAELDGESAAVRRWLPASIVTLPVHVTIDFAGATATITTQDFLLCALAAESTPAAPPSAPATVATPVLAPTPPATWGSGSQAVTATCATSGATIRFTTDGSDPSPGSSTAAPVLSATTTVKARAFKPGWLPSAVATGVYTYTEVSESWSDAFARANNGDLDAGAPAPGWNVYSNTGSPTAYGVLGSKAGQTASSGDGGYYGAMARFARPTADMRVTGTTSWTGDVTGGERSIQLRLAARVATNANQDECYLAVFDWSAHYGTSTRIFKIAGGGGALVSLVYGSTLASPRSLRFDVNGATQYATDGSMSASGTDSAISTGLYSGFWLNQGNRSGESLYLDDFYVGPVPACPLVPADPGPCDLVAVWLPIVGTGRMTPGAMDPYRVAVPAGVGYLGDDSFILGADSRPLGTCARVLVPAAVAAALTPATPSAYEQWLWQAVAHTRRNAYLVPPGVHPPTEAHSGDAAYPRKDGSVCTIPGHTWPSVDLGSQGVLYYRPRPFASHAEAEIEAAATAGPGALARLAGTRQQRAPQLFAHLADARLDKSARKAILRTLLAYGLPAGSATAITQHHAL